MKKYSVFILALVTTLFSCGQTSEKNDKSESNSSASSAVTLVVLGNVQDAGSPHIACIKTCCETLFKNQDASRKVVSLGVLDSKAQETFLFEATPDINLQLKFLKNSAQWIAADIPNGIFLTHAHVGHYTGLMYLGKEAASTKQVPVYAMPKMTGFLEKNGPWSQLVNDGNISLRPLENKQEIQLTPQLKAIPFTVPHRDEYSETVGYKIIGPNKSVLFIPDIDKWEKWSTSIISEIEKVDYAFLDATFYDAEEINNRDISEIPHPFVIESMTLFKGIASSEKEKIHFIHFNHTNPLLNPESTQTQEVLKRDFQIARHGLVLKL